MTKFYRWFDRLHEPKRFLIFLLLMLICAAVVNSGVLVSSEPRVAIALTVLGLGAMLLLIVTRAHYLCSRKPGRPVSSRLRVIEGGKRGK